MLSDTGRVKDGLPVVEAQPGTEVHVRALSRGFASRAARLYLYAQRYRHPDRPPAPAYLVLSDNQGGFPRRGFVLEDAALPDAGYVDLHRRKALSGQYAAIDQIFPHELLHLVVEQLAGPAPRGGANQVHAIGVTTDRSTAFNEGFAEHAQLMSIEAPDAAPETRALMTDLAGYQRALDQFEAYRRARTARWRVAPRAVMTFPLWFSRAEQVLRYHGVRDNLFARAPDVVTPDHASHDAYLLQNVLPGRPSGRPMSPARLMAREAVVSALFYRLATAPSLQQRFRDDGFYRRFGVGRADVDPLDNVYLKMFAAIADGGHDTGAVVEAWMRRFPEDAADVETIVRTVLMGQWLPDAPELWVMSPSFKTGTTLFDQFRGLPRTHAFDVNACTAIDLLTIDGMTTAAAAAIVAGAPYAAIHEVIQRAGLTGSLAATLERSALSRTGRRAAEIEGAASLSLPAILKPYAWRMLVVLFIASAAAATAHRSVRRLRWRRAISNGLASATVGLAAAWMVDPGGALVTIAVPVLLFGCPGGLWRGWRTRSPAEGGRTLAAWALSAAPAALLTLS